MKKVFHVVLFLIIVGFLLVLIPPVNKFLRTDVLPPDFTSTPGVIIVDEPPVTLLPNLQFGNVSLNTEAYRSFLQSQTTNNVGLGTILELLPLSQTDLRELWNGIFSGLGILVIPSEAETFLTPSGTEIFLGLAEGSDILAEDIQIKKLVLEGAHENCDSLHWHLKSDVLDFVDPDPIACGFGKLVGPGSFPLKFGLAGGNGGGGTDGPPPSGDPPPGGPPPGGGPPSVGGGGGDNCPCAGPQFDFGAAYFSNSSMHTHYNPKVGQDGPHFQADIQGNGPVAALGKRRTDGQGLLIASVDTEGTLETLGDAYDDDDFSIDQDGLDLTVSTGSSLFIDVNHIGGPSADPSNPDTQNLGTLIISRFNKVGDPHQHDFKTLAVLAVRKEGTHQVAIDPSEFKKEGWLRVIYTAWDHKIAEQPGENGARLQRILDEWDGTYSSLMDIFFNSPDTPTTRTWTRLDTPYGEIEDYQFLLDCDGNVEFHLPGEIPFNKGPQYDCDADTGGGGITPPGALPPNINIQVICNNVQNVVCQTPGRGTPGGIPGGTPPGVVPPAPDNRPIIEIIDDLYQQFVVDPANKNSPEKRLRLIFNYLSALLPVL